MKYTKLINAIDTLQGQWTSYDYLRYKLGLSRDTLRDQLNELIMDNVIKIERAIGADDIRVIHNA